MKKYVRIVAAAIGVLVLVLAVAFQAPVGVQASQVTVQVMDPEGPVEPGAVVSLSLNVQGRLTAANGVPINGSKTLELKIYDVSTGGVALCSDSDPVTVTNGLWSTTFDGVDNCEVADISGEQLYLGIKVVGEAAEMTPRQAIRPVPYAYSLVNGANIGSIKSSATTYVYVSPLKAVTPSGSNVTIEYFSDGYIMVDAVSTGVTTQWLYIPVDLVGTQYGTAYKFSSLRICYETSAAATYIDETYMRIINTDFTSQDAVADLTNRVSTSPSCYSVSNATLESIDGSAMVRLVMHFANGTDRITIGNIRIALVQ